MKSSLTAKTTQTQQADIFLHVVLQDNRTIFRADWDRKKNYIQHNDRFQQNDVFLKLKQLYSNNFLTQKLVAFPKQIERFLLTTTLLF